MRKWEFRDSQGVRILALALLAGVAAPIATAQDAIHAEVRKASWVQRVSESTNSPPSREVVDRGGLQWRRPAAPTRVAQHAGKSSARRANLRANIQRQLIRPSACHPIAGFKSDGVGDNLTEERQPPHAEDDPFRDPFGDQRPEPKDRQGFHDQVDSVFSVATRVVERESQIQLIPGDSRATRQAVLVRSTAPKMQLRIEPQSAPPTSLRIRSAVKLSPPTAPQFELSGPVLAQYSPSGDFQIDVDELDELKLPKGPTAESLPVNPEPMRRTKPVAQTRTDPAKRPVVDPALTEEALLNQLEEVTKTNPSNQPTPPRLTPRSPQMTPGQVPGRSYRRDSRIPQRSVPQDRATRNETSDSAARMPDTELQLSPDYDPANQPPVRDPSPPRAEIDTSPNDLSLEEETRPSPVVDPNQETDFDTVDPFSNGDPLQPKPPEPAPLPLPETSDPMEFDEPTPEDRALGDPSGTDREVNGRGFGDPSGMTDRDLNERDFDFGEDLESELGRDELEDSGLGDDRDWFDKREESDSMEEEEEAEEECSRVYNGRNCCQVDGVCQEAWQNIRRRSTASIDLDTAPPFLPFEEDEAKVAEEKAKRLAKAPSRTWLNREGTVIADGRLEDLRQNRVVIRTSGGEIAEVPFNELGADELCFVTAWWNLPPECVLPSDLRYQRCWAPITYTWTASAACHKPLYFEEVALERYGHSAGPVLQPLISTVQFYARFFILPYQMGMYPPCECRYALGHYRPGSCAPWLLRAFPLSKRGAIAELTTILGIWGYLN